MITGDSRMPFGKYKGEKIKSIPPAYLLALYHHNAMKRPYGRDMRDVMIYIGDNKDELQKRAQHWKTT